MGRNRYFEDEELKEKFNGKMIKKTLRFCRPYRAILIAMVILMLVMSFVALIPPVLNGFVVDYVIPKNGVWGMTWWQVAILIVSAWLVAVMSDVIFIYFRTFIMAKTGHSIVRDMRRDTFCNLQRLAFDYYDSRPAGKILVRVTNYLDDLANVFSSAVVGIIVDGTKTVMILVWLFILDYRLASVVVVAIIPMAIIIIFLRSAMSKRLRKVRNKSSNRTAFVAENIQGAFVTKAFNRTNLNCAIYRDLNSQANKSWTNFIHLNELVFPVLDGFFYLGLIVVYGISVLMATNLPGMGGLTTGTLISFIMYMGQISGPLNNIAAIVQQLSSATSNLERVFETMDASPSVFDSEDAIPLPTIEGNVTFEDVTFAYEKGRNILEHFSLDVPKGKMIALVGPTGAGKTTVVNLLSRFYDVTDGRVLIDGYDISKVQLHSLREQVGVMMQDSFVFSGTILENIRYARPDATELECIEVAKKVRASEFIDNLPQGYYTKTIEQGNGLSTGERQLLSFARVLLTDPKILILDEATSSIDTETEEKIKTALDEVLVGRTSFVIAHRLSTIRKADCILYIANKGIAECGTHAELMALKGEYYKLVKGN